MIRSRMAWAVATNQSRSVAALASLPTASASLARTALLNSVNSSSSWELVDGGMAFERLRPGSAMACAIWSSRSRASTVSPATTATSLDTKHYSKTYAGLHMPDGTYAGPSPSVDRGPLKFIFPEEFIGGYWPWNSFAGLMSWVGGVW